MKENGSDSHRADKSHGIEPDVEECPFQGIPVSELVPYNLVRHKPANEDAGEETAKRQQDLCCQVVTEVQELHAKKLQ